VSLGVRGPVTTTWYLTADEDGTYELAKRGRALLSGVPLARARAELRKRHRKGDRVFLVAPDGYRTRL
jgi:hypothetical protein